MGQPKPVLGYPSQTAAILAMQEAGLDNDEIGARIGISVKMVTSLAHSGQKGQKRMRRPFDNLNTQEFTLPLDIVHGLRPHAAKRDVTVNELVRRICDAVIEDMIVDAVLDDLPEAAE
ncbi:hypothetical protein [Rhodobium gokarnense]|uniref:Uncharacterized protein n=1 Tax=Rhodobium gokarnense TaxID=364296 RepID=A0ABT3HH98_9HYPH|nr:hypothetical protein [Rhodobium gokarnense]MCW2309679.1 hypothetical protein [Rhodobium gokarnense]